MYAGDGQGPLYVTSIWICSPFSQSSPPQLGEIETESKEQGIVVVVVVIVVVVVPEQHTSPQQPSGQIR